MTVIERKLPWQDLPNQPADFLAPVASAFLKRHAGASVDVIERAFAVADYAHRDQVRRSGEAYIHHPLAVATIVAELGLDEVTIAAALLHDAVEDTEISYED